MQKMKRVFLQSLAGALSLLCLTTTYAAAAPFKSAPGLSVVFDAKLLREQALAMPQVTTDPQELDKIADLPRVPLGQGDDALEYARVQSGTPRKLSVTYDGTLLAEPVILMSSAHTDQDVLIAIGKLPIGAKGQ